jgi:5-methylcytosine-specific restriction endonuclease McrA
VFLQNAHIHPHAKGGHREADNLLRLCSLCRHRHKLHYADSRIMPSWAMSPAVKAASSASHAA